MADTTDVEHMRRAIELGRSVRTTTSPNPWVGCVIVASDGSVYSGATMPAGGPHAEAVALAAAGQRARAATAYVTLEPCAHVGRTPPCADALVEAGVRRVVVGILDPDPVSGRGVEHLQAAGIEVEVGVCADECEASLAPYLVHRRERRSYVVLKLAATLDGRIAAPDGSSEWITGPEARADAHRLRAESDAVLVGAGTVRADDPRLTVRGIEGRSPLRVVLGETPLDASVEPALHLSGSIPSILEALAERGVLQLLVEGGATVAHAFFESGLVDRFVFYLAPALFGGDDAVPMFRGSGAKSMAELFRAEECVVRTLGRDLRIDLSGRISVRAVG